MREKAQLITKVSFILGMMLTLIVAAFRPMILSGDTCFILFWQFAIMLKLVYMEER
jgi:hypothetical protein